MSARAKTESQRRFLDKVAELRRVAPFRHVRYYRVAAQVAEGAPVPPWDGG